MGARDTVLVIGPAAGAGLFDWAGSLGLAPLPALPDPSRLAPGTDLVVVDLGCSAAAFGAHPDLRPWRRGTGRRVLIRAPRPAGGCQDGPPLAFFLSARECLRGLALGPEGLVAHYADRPADYLADCGEDAGTFVGRLRAVLGAEGSRQWQDRWREAVLALAPPGRVRDLGDLTLVLVPGSVHPVLALPAARCLIRARHDWLESGQQVPAHPLLLVLLAGEEAPWEMTEEIAGEMAGDPRRAVRGLRLFAAAADTVKDLAGWSAASKPLYYACAWDYEVRSVPDDPTCHLRALDHDLSGLCGRLLGDQRPLRHYGCTFFFPFDPGDRVRDAFAKALKRQSNAPSRDPAQVGVARRRDRHDPANACDTQAMLYFLPHLRDLLYDLSEGDDAGQSGLKPVREWRLTGTAGWRLELAAAGSGADAPTTAEVESVRLLRYFNGCYLLALRVTLPAPTGPLAALGSDGPHWWHPLVFGGPADLKAARGRSLARWLEFTRLARVVYPSFVEQLEEHKIAQEVRLLAGTGATLARFEPRADSVASEHTRPLLLAAEPGRLLSPVLRRLLGCFFGQGPVAGAPPLNDFLNEYQGFYDDRLFVNVAYGLAGPAPEPTRRAAVMGRLFSLALLVDRPVDDTFDDCGGYAYDRAWLKGTLDRASLGIWDETGLYAGFTDLSNAWLGAGAFFCEVAARRHVPYGYERMLILCLFYLASLRRYHRAVSAATDELTRPDPAPGDRGRHFRALRKDFIVFTNRYWFHEVTPQLQGRRIFELQQQGLGLQAEYQLIKDEMERAHEFLEADHDHAIRELSVKVTKIGLWVGVTALWATILSLIPMDGDIGPLGTALGDWHAWVRGLAVLLLAILPTLPLSWLLWKAFSAWHPWTGKGAQGQDADSPIKRR